MSIQHYDEDEDFEEESIMTKSDDEIWWDPEAQPKSNLVHLPLKYVGYNINDFRGESTYQISCSLNSIKAKYCTWSMVWGAKPPSHAETSPMGAKPEWPKPEVKGPREGVEPASPLPTS